MKMFEKARFNQNFTQNELFIFADGVILQNFSPKPLSDGISWIKKGTDLI